MVLVSFTQKLGAALAFGGQEFVLLNANCLYWPQERALLLADLHLEKGSWFAERGQLLPPYDSRDTLARVADCIRLTGARRVITLGDNFHDADGAARLDPHAAGMLDALTRTLEWVWITGNHDAGPGEGSDTGVGGQVFDELEISGIVLRHEAIPGEQRHELSGHFHPKMRIRVRNRHIARPCAVVSRSPNSAERMIAPAFGAYAGGLDAHAPAIISALSPAQAIDAVLPARGKLVRFPVYRAAA